MLDGNLDEKGYKMFYIFDDNKYMNAELNGSCEIMDFPLQPMFRLFDTYMHIQSINLGENPTDASIAAANQYAEWIEVPKQPKA